VSQYEFIQDNSELFSVTDMCKCFNIAPSSHYLWCNGPISDRAQEDEIFKNRSVKFTKRPTGDTDTAPFIITSWKMGLTVAEDGH